MTRMYKLLLLVFLIPLAVMATEKKGKYTKNKELNKEYTVSSDATIIFQINMVVLILQLGKKTELL